MSDIEALTNRVVRHLAERDDITVCWQNPPVAHAVAQIVKNKDGSLVIFIGELTSTNSKLQVLLHEISHARHDYNWIPKSNDASKPAESVRMSEASRQYWRGHWREDRAEKQADEWLKFAHKNAYKYWRVDRGQVECLLLSLLHWREE